MPGNQIEALFEDGHHAQPEQIDLDNPHVGAVFLVPLDDGASRHRRTFQGNDRIELTGANHHATRVLSQMARNILHTFANLQILGDPAVLGIEASGAETGIQCVSRPFPFPRAN